MNYNELYNIIEFYLMNDIKYLNDIKNDKLLLENYTLNLLSSKFIEKLIKTNFFRYGIMKNEINHISFFIDSGIFNTFDYDISFLNKKIRKKKLINLL